jgi:hypothetical protein
MYPLCIKRGLKKENWYTKYAPKISKVKDLHIKTKYCRRSVFLCQKIYLTHRPFEHSWFDFKIIIVFIGVISLMEGK